jgi:hypothetical protein
MAVISFWEEILPKENKVAKRVETGRIRITVWGTLNKKNLTAVFNLTLKVIRVFAISNTSAIIITEVKAIIL